MTAEDSPRTYTANPLVGAGVVVLRGDSVLLIKRARPPRQGHWSIPGGMQHLGETIRDAAAREVMEETGITIEIGGLLDVIDLIETDDTGRTSRHYTLVDFWATAVSGEPRPGDDASEARWFSREEALALPLWGKTRDMIALAFSRAADTGKS